MASLVYVEMDAAICLLQAPYCQSVSHSSAIAEKINHNRDG